MLFCYKFIREVVMKERGPILLTLAIALASPITFAQPVQGAGDVRSVAIHGQQVSLTLDNAVAEITVYSPSVVRVRVDRKLGRDFSYAVVAKPEPTKTTVTQNEREVVLATPALQAHVARHP